MARSISSTMAPKLKKGAGRRGTAFRVANASPRVDCRSILQRWPASNRPSSASEPDRSLQDCRRARRSTAACSYRPGKPLRLLCSSAIKPTPRGWALIWLRSPPGICRSCRRSRPGHRLGDRHRDHRSARALPALPFGSKSASATTWMEATIPSGPASEAYRARESDDVHPGDRPPPVKAKVIFVSAQQEWSRVWWSRRRSYRASASFVVGCGPEPNPATHRSRMKADRSALPCLRC